MRPETQRRVMIVGGGIAGMSLAILLRQAGWMVVLVESDPEWRVYGAGISITAPTFRAFQHLGILEEIRERGYCSMANGALFAADGSQITDLQMPPFAPGMPHAGGIMRPVLHGILAERCKAAAVHVKLGVTLTKTEQRGQTLSLTTSDGVEKEFDLLVGADGIMSSVREMMFGSATAPFYTGQFCWRLVADRPADVDRPMFFTSPRITAGLMPVSEAEMYLWLLEPRASKDWLDPAGLQSLLSGLLDGFGGHLKEIREGLSPTSNIISRPLEALLMPKPWYSGSVVIIGDAAHATTPHLASGAGLAIEDAAVLADMLSTHSDLQDALSAFMERRWERCRLVVENSIAIGQMQQNKSSPDSLNALMAASHKALLASF